MHLEIPHQFSQSQAAARVKEALEQSRAQIARNARDVEERWEENTLHFGFTAQGMRITGTLAVLDKQFVLDAKLPLMLRMFEGKIEQALKDEMGKYLKP